MTDLFSLTERYTDIHKEEQKLIIGEKLSSKVLIVKGTEDNSEQYMNFMNAVFTAQKKVK